MSLSINPQASLVAKVSTEISAAVAEAKAGAVAASNQIDKLNLDETVSRLGGELNSGLNGIAAATGLNTSGLAGLNSTITSNLQSVTGSLSTLGAIGADITGGLSKLGGGNLAGGLQSLAGSISKTAGMLNNILSLTRGANLPEGGELFKKQGSALKLEPNEKNDWRVKINCNWPVLGKSEMFQLLESTGGVVFPYTPNITVSTKANYTNPDIVHSNYQYQTYKNSVVDDISISGEFTAETQTDAAYWIAATTFFKTVTKMFYGQGDNAGNPPVVCRLTGYGSSVFPSVPVVVKSFEVNLDPAVNYINCDRFKTNTWVPVVSTITVVVSPVYSRARSRQFSLQQYATGQTISSDGIGFM